MAAVFTEAYDYLTQQRADLRQRVGRDGERVLLVVAALEFAGKVATWVSLSRRSTEEVRGPKWAWGMISGINFFGPVAYWLFGRKRR